MKQKSDIKQDLSSRFGASRRQFLLCFFGGLSAVAGLALWKEKWAGSDRSSCKDRALHEADFYSKEELAG